MAAIRAAELGNEVTILEKMERLGRKLLITGKGRCNITSSIDIKEFIPNIPGNGLFLHSSFRNYTNTDLINFFEENGLNVKTERGNRIFPVTDKSVDVLNVLLNKLKELNVKIKTNISVEKIIIENGNAVGVAYHATRTTIAKIAYHTTHTNNICR